MRISIEQLLMSGAHFGHLTRRWNPKMRPYIFMSKQGIHIIDLKKTQEKVEKACEELTKLCAQGDSVLFVGTKKQAKDIVRAEASRCNSPYVNERWLGGMLTNFVTIRKSVKTLESYEKKVTDGTYDKISKKERLMNEKAKAKLEKVLGGIRNMKRLPGAIIIIDIKKEDIAVAEAKKLGVPIFALVDTNVNPEMVEYPVPANDDSFKSIGLITRMLTDSILEGQRVATELRPPKPETPPSYDKKPPRKRKGGGRPHSRGGRQGGRDNQTQK